MANISEDLVAKQYACTANTQPKEEGEPANIWDLTKTRLYDLKTYAEDLACRAEYVERYIVGIVPQSTPPRSFPTPIEGEEILQASLLDNINYALVNIHEALNKISDSITVLQKGRC